MVQELAAYHGIAAARIAPREIRQFIYVKEHGFRYVKGMEPIQLADNSVHICSRLPCGKADYGILLLQNLPDDSPGSYFVKLFFIFCNGYLHDLFSCY